VAAHPRVSSIKINATAVFTVIEYPPEGSAKYGEAMPFETGLDSLGALFGRAQKQLARK